MSIFDNWIKSFASKRTQVTAIGLVTLGWKIYQLIQAGQPVPAEYIVSFFGLLGLWVKTDGERPTVPKPVEPPKAGA